VNIFEMLHDEFKFTHRPIRLFEAFSGMGSQFMALKRLGIETEVVGYSEIDKYAIQVYEALHGKHKNYGGIGSFDRLPKDIDICTWSFPCQDISLAGKQRGMNDETRSNYGYVFLDTVENTPYAERPKVLLMENVKALFSQTFAEDWREIQLRLEKLGYSNYAEVLNAKDYGVAQNRERVFIVSILGEYYYEFPKPYKLEKRLKDYLEDEVDEKYYLSGKTLLNTFFNYKGDFDRKKIFVKNVNRKEVSQTITTKMDRAESQYITEPFEAVFEPMIIDTKSSDNFRRKPQSKISPTILTDGRFKVIIPEATKRGYALAGDGDGVYINRPHQKCGVVVGEYRRDEGIRTFKDNVIGTIRTIEAGGDKVVLTSSPLKIRKLTPREALRLMDVSENDIDIILSEVSNTQAYKLAGNSIVVNVLVEIFKKLF
jgi:DNA (cytosine-5)-methyltransferase 1